MFNPSAGCSGETTQLLLQLRYCPPLADGFLPHASLTWFKEYIITAVFRWQCVRAGASVRLRLALCATRREDRQGVGWRSGAQYLHNPSWKKSFAQFYESGICPVGWFYQSPTATVERDFFFKMTWWATKPATCRVTVISQLNALQVNADNALSSFSFSFFKKSHFYRWLWADTVAARASVLRAKLAQNLCSEDEKTSWLHTLRL